jgi:hypothetical protein
MGLPGAGLLRRGPDLAPLSFSISVKSCRRAPAGGGSPLGTGRSEKEWPALALLLGGSAPLLRPSYFSLTRDAFSCYRRQPTAQVLVAACPPSWSPPSWTPAAGMESK